MFTICNFILRVSNNATNRIEKGMTRQKMKVFASVMPSSIRQVCGNKRVLVQDHRAKNYQNYWHYAFAYAKISSALKEKLKAEGLN